MRDFGVIQGSAEQAKSLIVGVDTVYVHTDIKKVEQDKEGKKLENVFQYHEVQYGKNEYIELMSKKNDKLEDDITNIQIAMVEMYER